MTTCPLHVSLFEAVRSLSPDKSSVTLLERREAVTVELYMPTGFDRQTAHDRDELYIIAAGEGSFSRGEETVDFGPGDFLHVPAHVAHRFERFDPGFAAWVVFYGPKCPPP